MEKVKIVTALYPGTYTDWDGANEAVFAVDAEFIGLVEGLNFNIFYTLDGNKDSTAGGDFASSFLARRTTLLSNPNLDENLQDWLVDEFTFSFDDADGHVTSGSALWSGAGSSSGMGTLMHRSG